MTAQPEETRNDGLNAYVFMRVGSADRRTDVGVVASTIQEAEASLEKMHANWPADLEKPTFFNIAVARMRPGLIEWRDHQHKGHEEKGLYAFLKGMFFCQCGDHREATHCAKYEDSRGRLTAIIYHGDHYVKPL